MPDSDADYLANALLATLAPAAFHHQRRVRGLALERLKAGFTGLVTAIVPELDAENSPGRVAVSP